MTLFASLKGFDITLRKILAPALKVIAWIIIEAADADMLVFIDANA